MRNPGNRLRALLMALIMLIGPATLSCAESFAYETSSPYEEHVFVTDIFTDVSHKDWFAVYVQKAYGLHLMVGVSDSEFAPQQSTTRAMVVQILYSMEGKPEMDGDAPAMPFEDVRESDWYYDAVCWAYANGITNGVSATRFGSDENISREQTATLIYHYAEPDWKEGNRDMLDDEVTADLAEAFGDADLIDSWALYGVHWAVKNGIFSGSPAGHVMMMDPLKETKRCESTKIFSALYEKMNDCTADGWLPEYIQVDKSKIPSGVTIPVLMYHEISDKTWGAEGMFVTPENMRLQMEMLAENGFTPIFLSDLDDLADIEKPVILTFDDGYEGNYVNLFPLLKEFNFKATIFMVTDHIGEEDHLTPEQMREMSDSGLVQFGSHTNSHASLNELTKKEIIQQCQASKNIISNITGISPYLISYPQGQHNELAVSIVSKFFSFGIWDRGGKWHTISNLFKIPRIGIYNTTTLERFGEYFDIEIQPDTPPDIDPDDPDDPDDGSGGTDVPDPDDGSGDGGSGTGDSEDDGSQDKDPHDKGSGSGGPHTKP